MYCHICGKPSGSNMICDECQKMVDKRRGTVVTKPAIVSKQENRSASSSRSIRHGHASPKRSPQPERHAGMTIAFGKDGLPLYCPNCSNLLYTDGSVVECKACDYRAKDERA